MARLEKGRKDVKFAHTSRSFASIHPTIITAQYVLHFFNGVIIRRILSVYSTRFLIILLNIEPIVLFSALFLIIPIRLLTRVRVLAIFNLRTSPKYTTVQLYDIRNCQKVRKKKRLILRICIQPSSSSDKGSILWWNFHPKNEVCLTVHGKHKHISHNLGENNNSQR